MTFLARAAISCVIALFASLLASPSEAADKDGYLLAETYYESLYRDFITNLSIYDPLRHGTGVRPYAEFDIYEDSRSKGGAVPQLYSDNYSLASAGIEYVDSKGFRAAIQGGISSQIGGPAAHPSGGDFRSSVTWFRGWGGPAASRVWYGNFTAGTMYASRYEQLATWTAIEYGITGRSGYTAFDLFAHGDGFLETNQQYYPTSVDGLIGLRIRGARATGFSFEISEKTTSFLRAVPSGSPTFGDCHVQASYGTQI